MVEFEIRGKRYPAPSAFRMCDPVLVEALTGLEWMDWTERLPDEDGNDPKTGKESKDPIVMLGMVGVAIWQAEPTWKRDRVVRFVQELSMEDVTAVGGEEAEERPPVEAAPPAAPSSTSAETSRETPVSDSDLTLVSSGLPG